MIWLRALRHFNNREVRLLLAGIGRAQVRILVNFVTLLSVKTKIAILQTMLFIFAGKLR